MAKKNILGIVGSPRKGGNTDILVSETLKGAGKQGARQEKIYLSDLQISPCKACAKCIDTGKCVIEDDFHIVLEKIKESDAIVLGSPVYCRTVTAQTKLLIDRIEASQIIKSYTPDGRARFLCRLKKYQKEYAKQGMVICIGDSSSKDILQQTADIMHCFMRDLGIKVVGQILENKLSEIGDVYKNKPLLAQAKAMGKSLERAMGIEPTTFCLASRRSTAELHPH